MKIVQATLSNAKDIASIVYNDGYFWSRYSFDEEIKFATLLLREGKEKVFLAKEKNKFVGYISIKIKNNIGELGMSVLKDCQGKGIGSKLTSYIIDFAKKKDCKKIKLKVWENNIKAINLYKKFGFVIKSEKKNFYDNGDSVLYMELNLA
ncbi:MAG: GNAT family N-acetyltransferase [Nanoarchaeota archaeon]|nr:GNAT family N-acetyltransferase [Nanoarchaeota archaeon]